MLKVVGASWYQKRISTYILVGSGMLVVAAFFIAEMERPQFDGTYCATVYWSKNSGFKIEYWKQRLDLENIPKGVARTCYKDSIQENGWSQIEIETQRIYPDWVQAFGAGLLEGSLTWNKIYYQWTNTISSACDRDENSQNFCTWLRDILSSNYHSIKELLKKRSIHDHYWHQISLFYYQLDGLETGWRNGAKRARSDLENAIPSEDFLLMNAAADIQDLKIYFENFVMREPNNENAEKNFLIPSATMLMKLKCSSNNNSDNNNNATSTDQNENVWNLFFGHSSAGSYSSMLRLQKRYKFHYHFTIDQKTNTIPGTDIVFTGYPGILSSIDDFYLIRGRHIHSLIAGVALKNHNLKLWNSIDINQLVPLSARVMAANRLSQSRRTWAKAMSRHPSTGSKQWLIIDLKKLDILKISSSSQQSIINDSNDIGYGGDDDFIQDHKNSKGIIWVVEQLPGRLHAEDMTLEIMNNNNDNDNMNNNNCLWFANGTPYFNEILDASQIMSNDDDINVSAIIKSKMNITSLDDVEQILHKYSFRGDLLGEQSIPYGNIDMKLFSYSTETNKGILNTIAGPLYAKHQHYQQSYKSNKITNNSRGIIKAADDLKNIEKNNYEPEKNEYGEQERRTARNDIRALNTIQYSRKPFKWSKVDNSISDVKHEGHPDEWNFDKISPKWAWYD